MQKLRKSQTILISNYSEIVGQHMGCSNFKNFSKNFRSTSCKRKNVIFVQKAVFGTSKRVADKKYAFEGLMLEKYGNVNLKQFSMVESFEK